MGLLISLCGYCAQPDEQSVVEMLAGGVLRDGATLFAGVQRVVPGSILRIDADGNQNAVQSYRLGEGNVHTPENLDELADLHREAVSRYTDGVDRVCVLLSGGIDSSLNSAAASEVAGDRTTYVTVGFDGTEFDETSVAQDVAAALGVVDRLQVISMDSPDVLSELPEIIRGVEHPTVDYSILPTTRICRRCRELGDVAIGGDGPDHLLGRKFGVAAWGTLLAAVPGSASLMQWLTSASDGGLRQGLWGRLRKQHYGRQLWLATAAASGRNGSGLANAFTSMLYGSMTPSRVHDLLSDSLCDRVQIPRRISDGVTIADLGPGGRLNEFSIADASISARAGVFAKIGKAAQATDLRIRSPYLSRPLVEYFWRLAADQKVRGSFFRRLINRVPSRNTKVVLRDLLAQRVPTHIIDRSKQGFEPPLAA